MAVRNKDFASLCRKVVSMKVRVEEKKRDDILGARTAPTESSVGTIGAVDDDISVDDSVEDVG